MKPPAIRRFRCTGPSRRQERGVTMVLVAIAMVAIIAMAALSIDVITLYLAREEAQRSADAAALAAARVISLSGITGTVDPDNDTSSWKQICGSSGIATQTAQAVGMQNSVGGIAATVTVTYSAGGSGPTSDCSGLPAAFAVNPMVTAKVTSASLPTFFSRIWGRTGNTVSATATAEAFNPSNSDSNTNGGPRGAVTPVQPRCVKPWIVPNLDPWNPGPRRGTYCDPGTCRPFVSTTDGSIQHHGINGVGSGGVIGETFNLFADCGAPGASCTPTLPPQANIPGFGPHRPPNLQYLPGEAPSSSTAVPSCGSGSLYEAAVAGCDQSTAYQCGVPSSEATPANSIDLRENPSGSGGDTATGILCLINQSLGGSGQDLLDASSYPFQITAGPSNPVTGLRGSVVTSSNSIVSLPIYDSGTPIGRGNTPPVTIVGFLQVFINQVHDDGSLSVTILNVAGCGGDTSNTAVTGSSPVPIRLITPP
jgi:Flp pilus assembly protein TadG